jgi:1,2-dihydroxy-3-keto-5-methylthiopentene dioxygenase
MASLLFEHGAWVEDRAAIEAALAPLELALDHDVEPLPSQIEGLVEKPVPSPEETEQLLAVLDERLRRSNLIDPLISRDLLNLNAAVASTDAHLHRFSGFHTHAHDEGRYIVAGACLFGFALPSGDQVRLTLHPRDLLRIPAGTEHWFQLTPLRTLKAVRLFSHVDDWVTTPSSRTIAPSLAV